MKQPDLQARKEYMDIVENSTTVVRIPGTKRSVKVRWMKPYTMEKITKVWIERDLASASVADGVEVAKDLAKEPYFAFKEAALMVLNNDLKIRFFYPVYWRWLAFRYNETQMVPIIAEGKKKVPLEAHFATMVYSMDMRTDVMKMTKREAEQYRAELLSEMKRLSSRIFPDTASPAAGSSGGSVTSGIGAS